MRIGGWDIEAGTREIALALAVISAGSILFALAFQYLGGFRPCELCLKERIAYYLTIPLGVLAALMAPRLALGARALLAVIALAFVLNAGLGVYHAGVEWHWWAGPSECTGLGQIGGDASNLLANLRKAPPPPRCDEPAFRFLGISFAGYSALLSAGLAVLALLGAAGWGAPVHQQPQGQTSAGAR